MAALCALVFRFPIPFAGYESGLTAVPRALLAAVFYGVLGGFVVLAIGGYAAGAVAVLKAGNDITKSFRLTLAYSVLVSFAGVLLLAVLDKIIGPW
jgi:hypothetical protein